MRCASLGASRAAVGASICARLELKNFQDAGFVGSVKLMAVPLLGAVGIFAAMILIRTLDGRHAELVGILVGGISFIVVWSGIQAIPATIAKPAKNPTIEVNRGGSEFEEVSIKELDLPTDSFTTVRIFVQANEDIPAADAKKITRTEPRVIKVPKGSRGEVYFSVDGKPPSLSTSY